MDNPEKSFLDAAQRYCASWLAGDEHLSRVEMIKAYIALREVAPRETATLRTLALAAVLALSAVPALAQQQPSPADRAVIASLQMQKLGVEFQQLANDFAQAQRRLAELEKLCGEKCAPAPEQK